jgi:hypothetical protein
MARRASNAFVNRINLKRRVAIVIKEQIASLPSLLTVTCGAVLLEFFLMRIVMALPTILVELRERRTREARVRGRWHMTLAALQIRMPPTQRKRRVALV